MRQIAIETASENVTLESISKIYAKDPKLADDVAKHLNYDSYSELMKKNSPKEDEKKYFTEDDIERIVSEREAKKEHEKSLKKAEKIISKIPDELQDEAQERFEKITK